MELIEICTILLKKQSDIIEQNVISKLVNQV